MLEVWKDINGYESLYQISSLGRVKSLARTIVGRDGIIVNLQEKIMKLKYTGVGRKYLTVGLNNDYGRKWFLIHRLVAEHFIDNIPNKMVVNHKDGNKRNNRVDNLEIITQRENIIKHRNKNNVSQYINKVYKIYDVETGETKDFTTAKDAGEYIGVTGSSIINHAKRIWSGTSKGRYKIDVKSI